ncbi:class I SAM-dependent methyltransferase [Hanamia caeni]|jgi:2-polyprenyl-3-methyl-5-hydroxy-6-metoxy-1,4-benzoquinol methylase|uniref:Class I SAM-dependent methyltransferase n=1 Tax=Hanamia caeni TaxID=2294116 RepID=A0A3M9N357_9BACT|nr:class I SAM-dependent methyltransferase [Hanamia caeni]RNI32189.1 class I SAM-dependent methyltransferase [Hanamia caeni]
MKKIEDVKRFYDEATIRKLHGFIYSNTRVEYALQSLNSLFNYKKPNRILEIGSGIGEVCYRVASNYPHAEVVGFDISEQSIKIATNLFILPNLRYLQRDSLMNVEFSRNGKFDVIFLMDVYEHIPVNERSNLHYFIQEHLSETGFIFLSCPTPQNLDYLRANAPSEIQPVDENINLNTLLELSCQTTTKLSSYREVSVWKAGDYFHAVFTNHFGMQPYSDFNIQKESNPISLKKKILRKIKGINNAKPKETRSIIQFKKDLIKKRLGEEILKKVEIFT